MEGIVKWFNERKGFGFIAGDDEKDYFLHYKYFIKQNTIAYKDDRVSFTFEETDKGLQARKVKIIK